MKKTSSELSPEEAKIMETIRNSVPMPDTNTPLQKVLNPMYVEGYFNGSFMNFNDGRISGCITTVDGAVGLKTPEKIFYGLRMDYAQTPFKPVDNSVTVIRFTSNDAENIKVPYGDNMPHPVGGNVSEMTSPFTGNGFTSATNGQIIPEFYTEGVNLNDGAQMFEITSNGEDRLIAIYDEDLMKFIQTNRE